MYNFHTQGFKGYAIQYSPFVDSRLAVAASANFGLIGNGRLYILVLTAQGIAFEKKFDTQDGLFGLAWSEAHENQLVVASGDGSIKLYDIALNDYPLQSWQGHDREVFSVHWNIVSKDLFSSSSWDNTWNPNRRLSLHTLSGHNACVYQALWSPHAATALGSCSGDGSLRIWDLRSVLAPTHKIIAHPQSEVLSFDWSKYRHHIVHTAGVDKLVKTWDLRNLSRELCIFRGHKYAVRKVVANPHRGDIIASTGYDMSVRIWQERFVQGSALPIGQQITNWGMHREFVVGLDWSLVGNGGWIASCGWDEKVWVWNALK